jgi:PKD repeat protein
LTFQGFDIDDFENGVGQLQVLVNGHLVVDLPAGLNHLSGSGDYAPYDNTWISFGPFDISSFVVQGQNTILFTDPQTSDHFGLVKNVTIVQGNTVLLHVQRARGVYPGFSFSYTFSVPPLIITSFTASPTSPVAGQPVTFTATYTGGTAPFRCIFFFGDDGYAAVAGSNGTCSAMHEYENGGTFTVFLIVKGASTSDLKFAQLTITVGPGSTSPAVAANMVLSTVDDE